jgi:hypothetical protein
LPTGTPLPPGFGVAGTLDVANGLAELEVGGDSPGPPHAAAAAHSAAMMRNRATYSPSIAENRRTTS